MRVLHVSFVGSLSEGLRNQLTQESKAAAEMSATEWTTIVYHNGPCKNAFERRIPFAFRNVAARKLFAWLVLVKLASNYDFIVQRYVVFDIFSIFFSSYVKNRITVHHAKEVEELVLVRPGLKGRIASTLESIFGVYSLKNTAGVVGVTQEIADYELARIRCGKPSFVFPNGIDVDTCEPLADKREAASNVAFVCSDFKAWHGLDRVLSSYEEAGWVCNNKLNLHLVGKLDVEQLQRIAEIYQNNGGPPGSIIIHGYVEYGKLTEVLSKCDVGLSSFGLDRKNLREACTLKVREYLALGLPVYSGHRDAAIPARFPYYRHEEFDIANLHKYCMEVKGVSRLHVRDAGKSYIDKRTSMKHLADWMESLTV